MYYSMFFSSWHKESLGFTSPQAIRSWLHQSGSVHACHTTSMSMRFDNVGKAMFMHAFSSLSSLGDGVFNCRYRLGLIPSSPSLLFSPLLFSCTQRGALDLYTQAQNQALQMSSPAASGDVLPALPPIRTVAAPARPSAPDARPLAAKEVEVEVEEAEPTTPTSEESRLRPPTECPPAPRKPAWTTTTTGMKRKSPSSPAVAARRVFFPVQRSLSTVFRSLPPKKKIRAG